MINRQALAIKTLSDELQSMLTDVIDVVNFIKRSVLNTRLFRNLCIEIKKKKKKKNLLFHSEVRWLSKGIVLLHICVVKDGSICLKIKVECTAVSLGD